MPAATPVEIAPNTRARMALGMRPKSAVSMSGLMRPGREPRQDEHDEHHGQRRAERQRQVRRHAGEDERDDEQRSRAGGGARSR